MIIKSYLENRMDRRVERQAKVFFGSRADSHITESITYMESMRECSSPRNQA